MNNVLINLALTGLALSHILGKTWLRGDGIDWVASNVIDSIVRFALPMLLIEAGRVAKKTYKNGDADTFFRDRTVDLTPFVIALVLFLAAYPRYDGASFDFEIASLLFSPAYPFYWAPIVICYFIITPWLISLDSSSIGRWALLSFAVFWIVCVILIPIPHIYFQSSFGTLILNLINNRMVLKLSGFFLFGLYIDRILQWLDRSPLSRKIKKINQITMLCALIVTLAVPFLEWCFYVSPWDHSWRDYVRPNVAVFGVTAYVEWAFLTQKGSLQWLKSKKMNDAVLGLYLAHSFFIELFVAWTPALPLIGMIFKTGLIVLLGFGFGWLYRQLIRLIMTDKW
ncbi:hypothetical protein AGMMS50276_14780 [Synergistales bacterium]|nr:hypothetical protein AGMMS50276_14780 [Synergistales bacterium]